MIEQGQIIEESTGFNFSYDIYKSPESGIISYHIDGFENLTSDNIYKDLFNTEYYELTNLRNVEIISPDNPIYKLIKSEEWTIIVPLTEKQYSNLIERIVLNFQ